MCYAPGTVVIDSAIKVAKRRIKKTKIPVLQMEKKCNLNILNETLTKINMKVSS